MKYVEDTCTSFSNDRCYAREAPKGCTTLWSANFQVISQARVAAFNWCPSFFSCFCLGPKIYGQLARRRGEAEEGWGGQERPTQSVSLSAILSGGPPFWHQQNHRRLTAPFSSPIILFARLGRVLAVSLIILSFSFSLSQPPYALATGWRNVGVDVQRWQLGVRPCGWFSFVMISFDLSA